MQLVSVYKKCECGCGGEVKPGRQYVHGHNPRPNPDRYRVEDRGHDTPCWTWQLYVNSKGYGRMWCSVLRRPTLAHRAMWHKHKGLLPDGIQLDHLCRNKDCVNPDHLEPVTNAENQRRARSIGSYERIGILLASLTTNLTQAELGDMFGLGSSSAGRIRRGEQ